MSDQVTELRRRRDELASKRDRLDSRVANLEELVRSISLRVRAWERGGDADKKMRAIKRKIDDALDAEEES